jgi:TM2 domain-containing membrane protein YozV
MPARYAPIVFGFILSALMSFLVSGIATFRNAGLVDGFINVWISAWLPCWLIAFPVVLVVAPIARRLVGMLVKAPAPVRR